MGILFSKIPQKFWILWSFFYTFDPEKLNGLVLVAHFEWYRYDSMLLHLPVNTTPKITFPPLTSITVHNLVAGETCSLEFEPHCSKRLYIQLKDQLWVSLFFPQLLSWFSNELTKIGRTFIRFLKMIFIENSFSNLVFFKKKSFWERLRVLFCKKGQNLP